LCRETHGLPALHRRSFPQGLDSLPRRSRRCYPERVLKRGQFLSSVVEVIGEPRVARLLPGTPYDPTGSRLRT
jgi:hypothetical protein